MNRDDACALRNGAAPRVCLISYWNDAYARLAQIARPNWQTYCERHGYALRFYPGEYREHPSDLSRYGDKGKFRLYYDVRGHVDIVMFLDIDALFMNDAIAVEDRLKNAPFLWTYDDNGPLSGLWIARTDDTTEKHLRRAYTHAATENNVRHGRIEPNGISDQDAMRRLMHVPPFSRTFANCQAAKEVGHCYPENYDAGDWIVTFPGRTVEEKLKGMETYAGLR